MPTTRLPFEGTARIGVFDGRLKRSFKDAYGAEYRVILGVECPRGGDKVRVALRIR